MTVRRTQSGDTIVARAALPGDVAPVNVANKLGLAPPEVPEAMANLILHMMAKNPDERCGSGKEVARRLQEILRAYR